MRKLLMIILANLLFIQYVSCKKFLDENATPKKIIPSKVEDLQGLLDDEQVLNQRSPKAMALSADEYYLTDNDWAKLPETERRMYIWEKERLFEKGANNDWGNIYNNVNVANIVLTYIDKVNGTLEELKNVKGQALFMRAQALLQAAFIWTSVYDEHNATIAFGIPLRSDADLNKKIYRATLKQTYTQVLEDLKLAAELLPMQPKHVVRASKPAAYALLGRAYMGMQDYENMGVYADLCLQFKNTLLDYNTLDVGPVTQFPFAPRLSNGEIIFGSSIVSTPALNISYAKVSPELYNSYSENDLRKKVLFKDNNNGTFGFRGSYAGTISLFSGIATNEVYLMRAEYYARQGITHAAMEDLHRILEKRFVAGTFTPLTAHSPGEALKLVLKERRKELILSGLRWIDLKRLNKDGASIELKRTVNGKTYVLPPNDLRYALPIPEDEIKLTGMEQNP